MQPKGTASGKKIVLWLVAVIVALTATLIVVQQRFWNSVEASEDEPAATKEVPAP